VSWIVLPDTDLTMPSTVAIGGAGGGLGAELVGLDVALADVPGLLAF
jgi:hypothetical protein